MIKIAKKYHEQVCTNETCIVYEKIDEPISIAWGLHAGLSLNTIDFGYHIPLDYSLGNTLGCRYEFENVLDWMEKLSFVLDFNFQRFSNYKLNSIDGVIPSIVIYNNAVSNYDELGYPKPSINVNIKTLVLKIPMTINYTFSKSNIRPYLGAGLVNMIVLSQNKDFKYLIFYDEFNKSIPTYHFGLTGKVGCKYILANKHSIYFELNYEHTQSLNTNQYLRFTNKLFSSVVGYAF